MKLDDFSTVIKKIDEAECVLVGLGEEWQVSLDEMLENEEISKYYKLLEAKDKIEDAFPYLAKLYYENDIPTRLERAYTNLKELLKDKYYFIVSTNIDSYLKKYDFKEERYVNPCGNLELLQCNNGCREELYVADKVYKDYKVILDKFCIGEEPNILRKCSCGAGLVFNNIFAQKYLQNGYIDKWNIYMKWLQGTVNRKLVVLELGVGLQYPTVIRWPAERTVTYNNKACLFRIHESLAMLTPEIAEKGYSCQKNSVDVISTCKNIGISL